MDVKTLDSSGLRVIVSLLTQTWLGCETLTLTCRKRSTRLLSLLLLQFAVLGQSTKHMTIASIDNSGIRLVGPNDPNMPLARSVILPSDNVTQELNMMAPFTVYIENAGPVAIRQFTVVWSWRQKPGSPLLTHVRTSGGGKNALKPGDSVLVNPLFSIPRNLSRIQLANVANSSAIKAFVTEQQSREFVSIHLDSIVRDDGVVMGSDSSGRREVNTVLRTLFEATLREDFATVSAWRTKQLPNRDATSVANLIASDIYGILERDGAVRAKAYAQSHLRMLDYTEGK